MKNLLKIALIGTSLSFSYGAQAQMSNALQGALNSCETAAGDAIPRTCYTLINMAESELATATAPNQKFLAHLAIVQPKNRFVEYFVLKGDINKACKAAEAVNLSVNDLMSFYRANKNDPTVGIAGMEATLKQITDARDDMINICSGEVGRLAPLSKEDMRNAL